MTILSNFFPVIIFMIAFVTAWLISIKYKLPLAKSRIESISGLRGFLALSVFIHHASYWFQYFNTGKWSALKATVYIQLGQTSVALFFMITSYLFVSKIINSPGGFRWRAFFVSRVFRLVPMYFFSTSLIILIVMIISAWKLNTGIWEFSGSVLQWYFFAINNTPAINHYTQMHLVNAGVEWSLSYEWLFYFSLPLISLLVIKTKPRFAYICLSLFLVVAFYFVHGVLYFHLFSFLWGAVAPLLTKFNMLNKKINERYAAVIVVCCLILILQFNSIYDLRCISIVGILFTVIANGCTFFGMLKNKTLQFLGEICYSTYLLHGIILFIVFYFIIGLNMGANLSATSFSFIVLGITPIIVLLSFFGYRFIELPFIDLSKQLLRKQELFADVTSILSKTYNTIRKNIFRAFSFHTTSVAD